jgi:hypothetical protein
MNCAVRQHAPDARSCRARSAVSSLRATRRGNEALTAASMKGLNMREDDEMSVDQYLAIRKEAALKIDPDTAEVDWSYIQIMDPYGVRADLPEECHCFGIFCSFSR